MRAALKELFNNVITLQYKLPHNDTPKSIVSTCEDFAFKPNQDADVANIIYNSIIDLAYDDYQIDLTQLNELQRNALDFRIRFNVGDDDAKLKLGFYGEALLNVFLQVFYGTDVLVARGEFFDLLSNSEVHGYDCHHIIEKDNNLEFWCGEVKFYDKYTKALEIIWDNINKDIALEYLNKNLQTIFQRRYQSFASGALIEKFIEECKQNPYRNFYEDIKRYNGKLVYPVLVAANEIYNDYDLTIKTYIEKIEKLNQANPVIIPQNIEVELFFIFLPVKDAKSIKLEVLECIQKNKPLI